MARSIALVVSVRINRSDRSLTAACGFRKSIWHREAQGVSLSAVRPHIWSPWGFTHPGQKQSQDTKEGRHYFSLFRSLIQTAAGGGPLSHCGCCEWMKGWMGGLAAASQPQQPTSASAGRPCEKPCARECRCLSPAGMGSAMESRNCMRTERDATDWDSDLLSRLLLAQGEREMLRKDTIDLSQLLLFFHGEVAVFDNMLSHASSPSTESYVIIYNYNVSYDRSILKRDREKRNVINNAVQRLYLIFRFAEMNIL